ncbi:MAG TPA: hypothetical protein VGL66_03830 [Caulobacteraceae bacterium]|jgi:hypothetical protein
MSTDTRDTPDNPYRKRDPWGARPAIPQVFTVTAAPQPMRRVFKPAPQAQAPDAAARERLHLTPVAEPYDEPPPRRSESKPAEPAPSPDYVTARRPPFAGPAPVPSTERRTFVGAAPPPKAEPAKPVERPSLAPFARSDAAPRPAAEARPAPMPLPPKPAPEAKPAPQAARAEPAPAPRPALVPAPAAAIAPPIGGFQPVTRASRPHRSLPKGLLVASLIVLGGLAAVAAVIILKPWDHPGAAQTLAADSARPAAPLTITRAPDPFASAAQAAATPASTPAPVKTAAASLAPHAGLPPAATTPAPAPATSAPAAAAVTPTLIDVGAPSPNAQTAAAAAPPKAGPAPIVVTPPPAADTKPAVVWSDPAKAPAAKPAGELISTSHQPSDTVGPHQ